MSLDDKLPQKKHTPLEVKVAHILTLASGKEYNSKHSYVKGIKQAFADEGYEQRLPKIEDGTLYPLVWAKAHGYMTGQEWYDRFEKLANSFPPDTQLDSPRLFALQLAKRAAGLDK